MERIHPLVAFVRRLDGEFYLRSEVAQALEVALEYLIVVRRKHPELAPSASVKYRTQTLRLYTGEDLNRLTEYFQDHHLVGRERKHSIAAAGERRRLHRLIQDYHSRAAKVTDEKERERLLGIAETLAAKRAAL